MANLKTGNYQTAFWTGMVGAIAVSIVLWLFRGMELTGLNFSMYLGTMLTTGPNAWITGFVWHIVNGGIFAVIYAFFFERLGKASGSIGVGFGAAHWVIAGLLMGLMPTVHPLMPEFLAAPGLFALNGGASDLLIVFAVHLLFGGIVGAIYGRTTEPAGVPYQHPAHTST